MDADNRTVSVVMATYNGEKYIREQLDSIVNQTYPIHELIVQDDHSTDSTVNILREYEMKFPFIHVFVNEENLGYKQNFRSATMKATGDFIAFADQDDIWFPDKIKKLVEGIGNHDICYAWHSRGKDMEHTTTVKYKNALERQMFHGIVAHSMLLRSDFVKGESHWLSFTAVDTGLSVCAHLERGIACVPETLNWHRYHSDSVSSAEGDSLREKKPNYPHFMTPLLPYIQGRKNYREVQKKPHFKALNSFIYENTSATKQHVAHELSGLLLKDDTLSLIRLMFKCMKYRETVYPTDCKGIKGAVRGFFYPFIMSYQCSFYDQ